MVKNYPLDYRVDCRIRRIVEKKISGHGMEKPDIQTKNYRYIFSKQG